MKMVRVTLATPSRGAGLLDKSMPFRLWVEREVGGGIGMGNTCKSMADSCQCMIKNPLQYCKVIDFQLIKINEKKKKKACRTYR